MHPRATIRATDDDLSAVAPSVASMLSDEDRALLEMEKRTFRMQGPKASAIRAELGLSMTAYTQRLLALIEREEALIIEPVLVNRLRRLQQTRRQRRTA